MQQQIIYDTKNSLVSNENFCESITCKYHTMSRMKTCPRLLTLPQGDSQLGSPALDIFHNAKSVGLRFSLNTSLATVRSPLNKQVIRG